MTRIFEVPHLGAAELANILESLKTALADRYAIEEEIGAGGMATVYLARDLKHHRQLAVKVLRPELAAALGPERFLLEIEIAAKLTHPHILPLHDSGEAEGFLYYVMPYVEGESLREKLKREKHVSLDEAIDITKAVGSAQRLAYSFLGSSSTIFLKNADGTGQPDALFSRATLVYMSDWSRDGRYMALAWESDSTGFDIWYVAMDEEERPRPYLRSPDNESKARFSPNGRYMAYVSDENGRNEVWVRPFPPNADGGAWPISADGGDEPVWGPDGRELFYWSGSRLMVARVNTAGTFTHQVSEVLFEGPEYKRSRTHWNSYDVHPDGDRFVMIQNPQSVDIVVVLNWFEELRRLTNEN